MVVAAGFVLAVTPAIQTATQNFESYSTKAFTTKTTKPLTGTTQGTKTLQSTIAPATESCATEQHPTLGENFYLCRRFNDDYEIVTGSVEIYRDGHYYKWVLEDHDLFDPWMTISCYVDGEWKRRDTRTEDGSFPCAGAGHEAVLEYDWFLKGNRAQCHGSCNDHDDEVDNSKMKGHITWSGRLPSDEDTTLKKEEPDAFKAFINKIREFLPWLK